jgi:hypothetical protein
MGLGLVIGGCSRLISVAVRRTSRRTSLDAYTRALLGLHSSSIYGLRGVLVAYMGAAASTFRLRTGLEHRDARATQRRAPSAPLPRSCIAALSRSRLLVATVTRPVAVSVGQARLGATARRRSEAFLRGARDAQAVWCRLHRAGERRDAGRRSIAGHALGRRASLTASDDQLPHPLRTLIARPGAGRTGRGGHPHGLDGSPRALQHLVATAADPRRLVSTRRDFPLAADPVDLVVG